MTYSILKEIDWKDVGALLANEDHRAQVAFFKGLVKGCESWGTAQQIEVQFANVNLALTPEERKTLSTITWTDED